MFNGDWKIQKQAEESLYTLLANALDAQPRQWQHSGRDTSRGRGDGCGALAHVSKSEAQHIERSIRDAAREVVKIQKEVKAPIVNQVIEAAAQMVSDSGRPYEVAESIRDSIYTLRHDAFISDLYRHEKRWSWDEAHAESKRAADESLQRELNRMTNVIYGRHDGEPSYYWNTPEQQAQLARIEEANAIQDHHPWWKIW